MADAKLTALTAASALAGADLFYVSQGGVSKKVTATQLLALVGTAYVPLAGGTMTGALTIASGTLTASAPALNITQTWNGVGVAFSAAVINVTNTASNGLGPLLDLQVAGTSVIRGRVDGTFIVTSAQDLNAQTGFNSGGFRVRSSNTYGFSSDGSYVGTLDVILARDAAATLAQRNGTTAQTLRVYGTYTDSSNYERLSLSTTAGTSVNITAETLGTGGDNLDLVLTPAGTGLFLVKNSSGTTCLTVASTTHATFAGNINVTGLVGFTAGGSLRVESDGVFSLRDSTAATFVRLNLGPGTASFPSLKRSGIGILVRTADDSADAPLSALYVKTASTTVAGLTAAATAGAGARAFVTDANATTFLSTVAAGGSNKVPVVSDGTNWLIG